MRLLQRFNDEQHLPGPGTDPGDQLQQLRSEGDSLLAAGDAAIRNAISPNAEAFLRAGRQDGGE
jgi:hypothetical protein